MKTPNRAPSVAAWSPPGGEPAFGIVGHGVEASPSPALHNAAYRALDLAARYRPFPATTWAAFWRSLEEGQANGDIGPRLAGLTVVAPFKEAAFEHVGGRAVSAIVRQTGAANLLVRTGPDAWRADSTDGVGVIDPLRQLGVALADRPVAVVGCGGSGRAAAVVLAQAGARVVVVNRGRRRGQQAADRLALPFVALSAFDPSGFTVVVHATPAGRDGRELPFAADRLARGAVLVDLVLAPQATPLVAAARARGVRVVDGHDVLVHQTHHQIARMTGRRIAVADLRALRSRRVTV